MDANVFVHAFLKIKTKDFSKLELKRNARKLIAKVDDGEDVLTSFVHFSEAVNILEKKSINPLQDLEKIFDHDSITFFQVGKKDYNKAFPIAEEFGINLNDALAVAIMQNLGIDEIYSFDKHFDKIPWIKRLTS